MKVGVDLGGTKILAVAVDDGGIVAEAKTKTPVNGGPLGVVDALAALVREVGGDQVEAVGVGAPGAVDFESGVVRSAPNLRGWLEPFPLASALSEVLGGAAVRVDNDVNVGTLAECKAGSAVGRRDVLGVFVGTGVGGALVLDGELRRGPTGFAGEIGHMVVRPGGRRCGCGGKGHLEAYAGRAGMERRARQAADRGKDTRLVELAPTRRMTSSVFAKALADGDAVAISLVDRAVETLGQALSVAAVLLDVDFVVVGGGLADRLGPTFVKAAEDAARSFMPPGQSQIQLVPAELSDRGGALGASLLVDSPLTRELLSADRPEAAGDDA